MIARFVVRSSINPSLILCTDGEFHADCLVGPGTSLCAKVYKTEAGARRVRGGVAILVERMLVSETGPYA